MAVVNFINIVSMIGAVATVDANVHNPHRNRNRKEAAIRIKNHPIFSMVMFGPNLINFDNFPYRYDILVYYIYLI